MDQVSTRRGVPGDAEAIAGIHVRGWRWAYQGLMPDDLLHSLSVEERAQSWRRGLERQAAGESQARTWVAERDGVILGVTSAGPPQEEAPPGTGELYLIYVDPAAVETGVGRTLMAGAMEDLHSAGFEVAILWVLETNDRARRFYERGGWRTDGAVKTEVFGGAQLTEVRYRVDLA